MPKELEDLVNKIKKTIKPNKPNQTKEEAAYAAATSIFKKHGKSIMEHSKRK